MGTTLRRRHTVFGGSRQSLPNLPRVEDVQFNAAIHPCRDNQQRRHAQSAQT